MISIQPYWFHPRIWSRTCNHALSFKLTGAGGKVSFFSEWNGSVVFRYCTNFAFSSHPNTGELISVKLCIKHFWLKWAELRSIWELKKMIFDDQKCVCIFKYNKNILKNHLAKNTKCKPHLRKFISKFVLIMIPAGKCWASTQNNFLHWKKKIEKIAKFSRVSRPIYFKN